MARSASFPPLALLPALLLSALLAGAGASADVLPEGYELVVLGEPTAPAVSPESGPVDLTLTWRVREIFAGEPGAVSIAVRHRGLSPAQARELGSGERWVLLANRDAERTGRWEAGMPLKATPAAVDAFRKWSAPPDVRPPRAVGEVVEEVRGAAPAAPPGREPVVEATPVSAEGPIVVEEEPEPEVEATLAAAGNDEPAPVPEEVPVGEAGEGPSARKPERVAEADPDFAWIETVEPAQPPGGRGASVEHVDRLERPAPAPASAPESVVTEAAGAAAEEEPAVNRLGPAASTHVAEARGPLEPPTYVYRPVLVPPDGPGLPPSPPPRPIGPTPEMREDLRKAKSSEDDA